MLGKREATSSAVFQDRENLAPLHPDIQQDSFCNVEKISEDSLGY